MLLNKLGWIVYLKSISHNKIQDISSKYIGRIVMQNHSEYKVLTKLGEFRGEVSGEFRYQVQYKSEYPVVGDWVIYSQIDNDDNITIKEVLPRFSKFSRNQPGKVSEEQIISSNINTIFILMSLDYDFNLRRLERYLLSSWISGANPVILLSKCDLCSDVKKKIKEVESVSMGVPIIPISVTKDIGINKVKEYLNEGQTIALIGSSGVGKSTLYNYLIGSNIKKVDNIQKNNKGKHTTTSRELIILDSGGVLIDNPGMRELQIWSSSNSSKADTYFADINEISKKCYFKDCSHESEPNCAVKEAVKIGTISKGRLSSFKKLKKEINYLNNQSNKRSMILEKKKRKKLGGDRTRFNRRKT